MDVTLRDAQESDVEFLLRLRNATMNEHILREGIDVSQDNHLDRVHFHFESAKIIQADNKDIGLFKVQRDSAPWDLIQIQLLPEYQGRGIGRDLIARLQNEARLSKASIVLSVYKNNPAFKLYSALNFVIDSETEKTFEMKWSCC